MGLLSHYSTNYVLEGVCALLYIFLKDKRLEKCLIAGLNSRSNLMYVLHYLFTSHYCLQSFA